MDGGRERRGVKSGGQGSGGEEKEGEARRDEAVCSQGSSNLLFANWILVLQIKECGDVDGGTKEVR